MLEANRLLQFLNIKKDVRDMHAALNHKSTTWAVRTSWLLELRNEVQTFNDYAIAIRSFETHDLSGLTLDRPLLMVTTRDNHHRIALS
jgi:hypothetical protein